MMQKVVLAALVASAAAFVPAQNARVPTRLNFEYGEYDDKLWDQVAKKDVYNKWDPNSPRSTRNFNPFETFKGNSPDASGIFPGENRYKDPVRGDANFQTMMAERADAEERAANPKPGDAPGCPGCKN
uniref:PS II complex 12 kDa extrinsic protein n=2 Tax=Sar TaxID=2698737 RepID=A0A6U1CHF6_9STRA|mmetsp:Transcript_3999/g.8914  ORF Transcript_3999/g.8914 Transcript_3999/m.8914 type:complete len:128 (+) Transcript_3999:155-538(+)|eukprot:CAMPEP_0171354268 /NCGR_PEP_ID=MMETSP0878-20121228/44617_1 /TAXON_ID=67004 /ORGANISM="Thalassiosira weissflogii, Strain CCMP1336" /LENGTH=127 /DNA_ID=CAMNT_0011860237 /DNA_START=622 /DNA_END=1005 /DNA_ORIENTATION=+